MISVSSSHKKTGICISGEGTLLICDIEEWLTLPWFAETKSVYVELAEGVNGVEQGLFALIPNLGEIEAAKCVKDLGLDEQTVSHLRTNGVLLRGEFDSTAEKAAKDHRLAFVHSDIELARAGDYSEREGIDIVTLKFDYNSKPMLQLSNFCQGRSAGSSACFQCRQRGESGRQARKGSGKARSSQRRRGQQGGGWQAGNESD